MSQEVSEYIITGGYPETDPRHNRVKAGIHEQFVKLLNCLAEELQKRGGSELPASWISGFYGSGKSSFAKLLGLALDGMVLPDNRTLLEALLVRDDSPKAQEFQDAWERVQSQIDPIAVVFDIGAVARDDEHIHSAVKRQIQQEGRRQRAEGRRMMSEASAFWRPIGSRGLSGAGGAPPPVPRCNL